MGFNSIACESSAIIFYSLADDGGIEFRNYDSFFIHFVSTNMVRENSISNINHSPSVL